MTLSKQRIATLLALPILAYLVAFLVAPVATVVESSLQPSGGHGLSWGSYVSFFSSGSDIHALYTTFVIGLVVSALLVALCCPFSYFLVTRPAFRRLILFAVVAPMFVNAVVRIFGLEELLTALNGALVRLHVVSSPLPLLYSNYGVVIGFLLFLFPYMALTTYASIASVPAEVFEAAQTLGASRLSVMRLIAFPAMIPGIAGGTIITFTGVMGSYIVPSMLGGGRVNTLPILIYNSVSETVDWSAGSAISVVLVVLTLPTLYVASRRGFGARVAAW